jgi:hypothetical protein
MRDFDGFPIFFDNLENCLKHFLGENYLDIDSRLEDKILFYTELWKREREMKNE